MDEQKWNEASEELIPIAELLTETVTKYEIDMTSIVIGTDGYSNITFL